MKYIFISIFFCLSSIGLSAETGIWKEITIKRNIKAPIQKSFTYIVPVPLERIFKKFGRLPGVTGTNQSAIWNTAGLSRTVYFEDGSSAIETLDRVEPYSEFSYHIVGFTSSLRYLAHRIEGNWVFKDPKPGETEIEWSYKIQIKNAFAEKIFSWFVEDDLRGMLSQAMDTLQIDLEGSQ